MKIKVHNTNIPYIVIDDWYTEKELKETWNELDFYTNCQDKEKIARADNTLVARDNDGKSLSEAYRWYPPSYFTKRHRNISSLHKNSRKLACDELHSAIKHLYPWYNMYSDTNTSTHMISYYESGDYYKPHHDTFMYTVLIWLTKKPKMWTGGDLSVYPIKNKKEKVLFKNNRAVIFPCMMNHEVSPIEWIKKPKDIGYGRYTITYFLYFDPERYLKENNISEF